MSRISLGKYVLGFAAVFSGVVTFAFRDINAWRQIVPLDKIPHSEILLYIVGAAQLIGGIAIPWPATRRIGAVAIGVAYFVLTSLTVQEIVANPLAFSGWGDFGEQFSVVAGALIIYAASGPNNHDGTARLARLGYVCFGVCVASFAGEQLAFFTPTVNLVPKWIPPGQLFWAVATTMFFGLAAVAMRLGRFALLAARLLTIMLVGFGILIWVPAVISNPHKLSDWTENNLTFAIAGAAWIVADFLASKRS